MMRSLRGVFSRGGRQVVNGPVVLMYHRVGSIPVDPWNLAVSASNFAEHMSVLAEMRQPLSMNEFVLRCQESSLPTNAVAVTFDDGYVDNLLRAKPILESFCIPATVFVSTGFVNSPQPFWWDALSSYILESEIHDRIELQIGDEQLVLENQGRGEAWDAATQPRHPRQVAFLKAYFAMQRMTKQECEATMERMADTLGGFAFGSDNRPMSTSELKDLVKGAWISLGGHTFNHAYLPQLSHGKDIYEISMGKQTLEELVGCKLQGFAYPYGAMNSSVRDAVRHCGFNWACIASPGQIKPGETDLWSIPRLPVRDWDASEFQRILSA